METLKLFASQALLGRFKGSGWTKAELLFQWQTLLPPPSTQPLVLILRDVSVAHVCECQWKAALWLFYELHYWFPILLRTENVIMHRPRPNPLILAEHIFFFIYRLLLSCLLVGGFSSICLSLLSSVTCLSLSHHLTSSCRPSVMTWWPDFAGIALLQHFSGV